MRKPNYLPIQTPSDDITKSCAFIAAAIMAGLELEEIMQAVYDSFPSFESAIVVLQPVVAAHIKAYQEMAELKSFWEAGDDE